MGRAAWIFQVGPMKAEGPHKREAGGVESEGDVRTEVGLGCEGESEMLPCWLCRGRKGSQARQGRGPLAAGKGQGRTLLWSLQKDPALV